MVWAAVTAGFGRSTAPAGVEAEVDVVAVAGIELERNLVGAVLAVEGTPAALTGVAPLPGNSVLVDSEEDGCTGVAEDTVDQVGPAVLVDPVGLVQEGQQQPADCRWEGSAYMRSYSEEERVVGLAYWLEVLGSSWNAGYVLLWKMVARCL